MRILITGASGRVGSHVARQLAEDHHITATGRSVQPRIEAGATWRRADLADPQPWRSPLMATEAAFPFPAFGGQAENERASPADGPHRLGT